MSVRTLKRMAALALTGTALVAGSVALSGPANAATSPYDACGGGSYSEIDHHDLSTAVIYLLYNGSTDCVVTWKNNPGTASPLGAEVQQAGAADWVVDFGDYTTYAGPVKVYAPGVCIRWGGSTGSSDAWASGPSHCG